MFGRGKIAVLFQYFGYSREHEGPVFQTRLVLMDFDSIPNLHPGNFRSSADSRAEASNPNSTASVKALAACTSRFNTGEVDSTHSLCRRAWANDNGE